MAADDGECVEDVGGVLAGEDVEVEVEGVEAGAQVAGFLVALDDRRAVVAEGRELRGPCRGLCRLVVWTRLWRFFWAAGLGGDPKRRPGD